MGKFPRLKSLLTRRIVLCLSGGLQVHFTPGSFIASLLIDICPIKVLAIS